MLPSSRAFGTRLVVLSFGLGVAAAIAGLGVTACSSEGVVGSLATDGGSPEGSATEGGPVEPLTPSTAPLAAGGSTTCVKTAGNELRCWGDDSSGSLGQNDSSPGQSATPLAPYKLGTVRAVFGGETSICALREDGKAYCWGDMFVGDFNGQAFDHLPLMAPLSIEGAPPVAHVAVGRYFLFLLGLEGDVRGYGLNDHGQLGVGSTDKQYLPTLLTGFDGPVTSLSASMGGLFACATTAPGSVFCWGDNTSKVIAADGATALSPRKIEGLVEPAVEIVAGGSHACARLASGAVKCWGAGEAGQLGNGATRSSGAPVDVLYLTDVSALAAGLRHTCAVRSEGSVFCWGDDTDGQAGSSPDPSRPLLVKPATFAGRYVSCGLAHTCAWATGGRVECWGSNARSQLGPGKATF
jgi:alpha-tubulin suppressor-like RCC1 family protein